MFATFRFTRARLFSTAPSLSAEAVKIVKSTAPIIAEHGYTITSAMYKKMLTEQPSLRTVFNPTHQVTLPKEKYAHQPKVLAESIHAVAANLDNMQVLNAAIERIAQKHVSLHVLPEQYPVVKHYLFGAMSEVLGSALTPPVVAAWSDAFDVLSDILITREKTLREEKAAASGGWEGFRAFTVVEKKEENADITSFLLRPADGKPILQHEAGHYVAVQVETPYGLTVRNYTLSCPPGSDHYRITVKKLLPSQDTAPAGDVSTHLHERVKVGDTVSLGVPCGDFTVETKHNKPIVLIGGGVGITPLVSMFEHLMQAEATNPVTMIHCCRDAAGEAMKKELLHHAKDRKDTQVVTLHDTASPYTSSSIIAALKPHIANTDAHFYFCGPPPFMKVLNDGLKQSGVPVDQIHYEFFGPTSDL